LPLTLNVRFLFCIGDEGLSVPRPLGEEGDDGTEAVMVTLGGFSNELSLFTDHGASGARGVVGEYDSGRVVDFPCSGLLCNANGLVGPGTGLWRERGSVPCRAISDLGPFLIAALPPEKFPSSCEGIVPSLPA